MFYIEQSRMKISKNNKIANIMHFLCANINIC